MTRRTARPGRGHGDAREQGEAGTATSSSFASSSTPTSPCRPPARSESGSSESKGTTSASSRSPLGEAGLRQAREGHREVMRFRVLGPRRERHEAAPRRRPDHLSRSTLGLIPDAGQVPGLVRKGHDGLRRPPSSSTPARRGAGAAGYDFPERVKDRRKDGSLEPPARWRRTGPSASPSLAPDQTSGAPASDRPRNAYVMTGRIDRSRAIAADARETASNSP